MQESFIASKPRLTIHVIIDGSKFKVLPLASASMPKTALGAVVQSIHAMASFYLIKCQGHPESLYTSLLLYFSNEGWLINECAHEK